jgi:hypothetical protein
MPDNEDMARIAIDKAAEVILIYAISDEFNWERDKEILVQIADGAAKLKAILDAREKASA